MMQSFDFSKDFFSDNKSSPKIMVEANAGTGKTYSIEHLYGELLMKNPELKVEQILVVTYTKAATAELKQRLRDRLVELAASGDKENALIARRALASFDLAPIYTIHGFCQRVLEEFSFESGATPDAELVADDSEFLDETVRDYYSREVANGHEVDSYSMLSSLAKKLTSEPRPVPVPALEINPSAVDGLEQKLREAGRTLVETVLTAGSASPKFDEEIASVRTQLAGKTLKEQVELILSKANLKSPRGTKPAAIAVKEAVRGFLAARDAIPEEIKRERVAEFLKAIEDSERGYAARKRRANIITYNDLLGNVRRALENPDSGDAFADALRKTYKVAIVDEFQDTDPTQYLIFEKIFDKPGWLFFMMGDPKQAIYSFRCGDIETYKRARNSVDESSRYGLAENYRSTPRVISAVNELFKSEYAKPELFGKPVFLDEEPDYQPSSCGNVGKPEKLNCRIYENDGATEVAKPYRLIWLTGKIGKDGKTEPANYGETQGVFLRRAALEIATMLSQRRYKIKEKGKIIRELRPSDFAVLVEQNEECNDIKRELKSLGVPAVVLKSGNVFASSVAKDMAFILEAMLNPQRLQCVKSALLTPWCGMPAAEVANPDYDLTKCQADFAELGALWRERGIMSALGGFMRRFGAMENVSKMPECERLIVNERHLAELLREKEERANLKPEGVLKFLHESMSGKRGAAGEEYEERLESDSDAVSILTVYKAKGLEFPIVFCPTLSRGFRGSNDVSQVHDEDGTPILPIAESAKRKFQKKANYESFAERLRLLYVALTRASAMCVMLGGNVKFGNGMDLRTAFHYLLWRREHPEAMVERGNIPRIDSVSIDCVKDVFDVSEENLSEYSSHEISERTLTNCAASELSDALDAPDVVNDFAVMSYSGMIDHTFTFPSESGRGGDEPKTPCDDEREKERTDDPLPGSAATGLAVHKVFELVDYRDGSNWNAVIEKALRENGLADTEGETVRRDRVCELVGNSLAAKLPQCDFALNTIVRDDTKREWKFFSAVDRKPNLAPFRELGLSFKEGADRKMGCITGEMDLIFRKDGKHYFADWKTDRIADYSPSALKSEMARRGYLFQAFVYAIALRDLLKRRLGAEYDFDKHFGGGFYFFVRGVKDGNGICRFNPTDAELDRFQACFVREG